MQRTLWHRLGELFHGALAAGEGRSSFLARHCPDEELRREVESLLASHDQARPLKALVDGAFSPLLTEDDPLVGARLGPYEVECPIGQGGMGAVYLALRVDGRYERQVAVKVVHGARSEVLLERFRVERNALARLDHPYIARLLDAGETPDGRPYLVMDWVDGQPIDAHCRALGLGRRERLGLFREVCTAVHYAHQRLLVHCDLKPSNILVARDGSPRLLDFGIARVLASERRPAGEASAVRTGTSMTVDYASPEQIRGEPLTTASDVYSLGVILHELLTGHLPPRTGSPDPAAEATLPERAPDAGAVDPALAGDLAAIARKAMSHDPQARYASALQLSEDVGRHLAAEPVHARVPTLPYRWSRFLQRNRAAALAGGVALAALLAGMAGTGWQARRAAGQRDRALEAQRRAEESLARARLAEDRARTEARASSRVADFVVELFAVLDPSEARGGAISARELLDGGAERLERGGLSADPALRARLLETLGSVYRNLGLYGDAAPRFEEALRLRESLPGTTPGELADDLDRLGGVRRLQGELDASERLHRRALALRREHPENEVELGRTLARLGLVSKERGAYDESERLHREALAILRARLGERHEEVAHALVDLAGVLRHARSPAAALPHVREAASILVQRLGPDAPDALIARGNLATTLSELGRFDEAHATFEECLADLERVLGPEHPETLNALGSLAVLEKRRGRLERAEEALRRVLEGLHGSLGPEHPDTLTALANLALMHVGQGRLDEAETLLDEAVDGFRRVLGPQHAATLVATNNLAGLHHARGNAERARELFAEVLETQLATLGEANASTLVTMSNLAGTLRDTGRVDEALAVYERALERSMEVLTAADWRTGALRACYGECLLLLGRAEEAEPHLRAGHGQLLRLLGPHHPQTRAAGELLAGLEAGPGGPPRPAPAE